MATPVNPEIDLRHVAQLLDSGQSRAAQDALTGLLAEDPDNTEVRRLMGMALLQQNQNEQALEIFENIFKETNGSAISVLDLSRALGQSGQSDRATMLLEETLERIPTLTPGWYLYGDLLVEQKRFPEARKAYHAAMLNDPFREQIDQAKEAMRLRNFSRSEEILRSVISKDPLHTEALAGLEALAMAAEDWMEAERLFGLVKKRTLYWPTILTGLSQLFMMTNRTREAVETLETLVKIHPDHLFAWNTLGMAQEALMHHDEAIAAFARSLQLEPNQPRTAVALGNVLRVIGKRADSIKTFEEALRFTGMNGEAFWGLSNLKDYRFSDSQIDAMRASIDQDSTSVHNAAPIYFALGSAMEEQQNYEAAFAYYVKGNEIHKRTSAFDAELFATEVGQIRSTFDASLLQKADRSGASSAAPIFIVGMPRTGSTLVEQILATHSDVDATMELPFIQNFVREFGARESELGPYPELLHFLDTAEFDALADRYMDLAGPYRGSAPRFTDKMPNNFVHLGLIHLLFPNAVFVDITRHPLDTCLSGFKQRFAAGQSYSYSLDDLGAYYKGYRTLMQHWVSLLPHRVFRVVYEELVTDTEKVVRDLLDFCGLGFESACLHPETTERAIRTPSSEQVRKPIATDRIDYWRHFEPNLSSLRRTLETEIQEYEQALGN